MKKLFINVVTILTIACVFALTGGALAAKNYGLSSAAAQAQYDPGTNVYSTVQIVIDTMLIVIAFVFFGYTTYAGLRWLTARGNEEFVTKAKDTMSASIIGLVITMAAYAITNFVFSRF